MPTTTAPNTDPHDAIGDVARVPTTRPSPGGPVGKALNRVDGRLKVTGQARYAAEAPMQGIVHAVLVPATIATGSVTSIEESAAKAMPGVLLVLTPANMPRLGDTKSMFEVDSRKPLSDMRVVYPGQHVACVVADTLDRARAAARALKITYQADAPAIGLDDPKAKEERPATNMGAPIQLKRGDPEAAEKDGSLVKIEQTYVTPTETHNPMELHATVAAWDGTDKLTVWDATQYVVGTARSIANAFGLKPENVRVIDPFVGGGFGCKGSDWGHTFIAVAAAKLVGKPVKLVLTRSQLNQVVGHRPETRQTVVLAANKADNKLALIRHDSVMHQSRVGKFIEPCAMGTSKMVYASPNLSAAHITRIIDVSPGTFMRAPGEASGTFALESALDELAYALGVDPIELRIANHTEVEPDEGTRFSAKHLLECYRLGAEKFGWSKRSADPGSMKGKDGKIVGWGCATATYPAYAFPGSARIRLSLDESGNVRAAGASAVHDLGTGAITVGTQITAQLVGLPMERVKFELGDSTLPEGPVAGGSTTTATVARALGWAADELKRELIKLAAAKDAAFAHLDPHDVKLEGGSLSSNRSGNTASVDVASLIKSTGKAYVEAIGKPFSPPGPGGAPGREPRKDLAFHSFGVHFVEITIDEPVPLIRVRRVVSVMNVGTVINPKTTRSQVVGGVTMGIGMALTEHTVHDPRTGRVVNDNLADYAVPVNPDVHAIETYFVEEPDYEFNPMGCRGVGEIGITGVAAAIANAVYHATGKRIRELPLTPDKLL